MSLLARLLTLAALMRQLRSPISMHQCATHGEETEVGVDYVALSAADDWISGETGACSRFLVVAELGGSPDERG